MPGSWQQFYDPFALMAATVVGYNAYLGAFVPAVENPGAGVQYLQMDLIFGPIAGLGGGADTNSATGPQTQTPAKPAKKPCTPLLHDPSMHELDTLVDGFVRATHPLDMVATNGALFLSAGTQVVGGGLAIAAGCLEPTPFEPITCAGGGIAGGAVVTAGVGTAGFGVYFFKNYTLPAIKDGGCHE
jgi:hypothetical protein